MSSDKSEDFCLFKNDSERLVGEINREELFEGAKDDGGLDRSKCGGGK